MARKKRRELTRRLKAWAKAWTEHRALIKALVPPDVLYERLWDLLTANARVTMATYELMATATRMGTNNENLVERVAFHSWGFIPPPDDDGDEWPVRFYLSPEAAEAFLASEFTTTSKGHDKPTEQIETVDVEVTPQAGVIPSASGQGD